MSANPGKGPPAGAAAAPKWDQDRAAKQAAALKAREKARAYLASTNDLGNSIDDTAKLLGEGVAQRIRDAVKSGKDNTLEEVAKRDALKRKAERDEAARKDAVAQEAAAKRQKQAAAVKAIAPGWMAVDDGKGGTYYWNTKTHATTWDRPEAADDSTSSAGAAKPAAAADATTATKAPAAATTKSDNGTAAKEGAVAAAAAAAAAVAAPAAAAVAAAAAPEQPQLLPGWRPYRHPATGQQFWVHEQTKERRRAPPYREAEAQQSKTSSS